MYGLVGMFPCTCKMVGTSKCPESRESKSSIEQANNTSGSSTDSSRSKVVSRSTKSTYFGGDCKKMGRESESSTNREASMLWSLHIWSEGNRPTPTHKVFYERATHCFWWSAVSLVTFFCYSVAKTVFCHLYNHEFKDFADIAIISYVGST